MFTEVVKQYIANLGGIAIVVAAVAWLMKKFIDGMFKSGLEAHKAGLKAAADLQLEAYKIQAGRQSLEHEIQFKGTYQQRSEIFQESYSKLQRTLEAVRAVKFHRAMFPEDKDLEKTGLANTHPLLADLTQYVYAHLLWFPLDLEVTMLECIRYMYRYSVGLEDEQDWDALVDNCDKLRDGFRLILSTSVATAGGQSAFSSPPTGRST